MGEDYLKYSAKEADLYHAIGDAVSRWARIEYYLLEIFCAALSIPGKTGATLLANIKTFSLMLDLTNSAVRCRFEDKMELIFWHSLFEYLRELSGDRNFMAHTTVVGHGKRKPTEMNWNDVTPMIGPSSILHLAGDHKMKSMDTAEVRELAKDFQQALEFCAEFAKAVASGQTSQQKFYSPVSRRRPTRKQRQEASPPKRKRQPQSSR